MSAGLLAHRRGGVGKIIDDAPIDESRDVVVGDVVAGAVARELVELVKSRSLGEGRLNLLVVFLHFQEERIGSESLVNRGELN